MIILLSILLFLFLVVFLILILPVRIEVDSRKELLRVYMPFFFSAGLYDFMSNPDIRLRILLIKISPRIFMKGKKDKKKKKKPVTRKKEKKKVSFSDSWKMFRKIAGKIQIRKLSWIIDTGNFPLNAQLYPIAEMINKPGREVLVNFDGRNSLYLLIQTRIISLLIIIIKNKLSNLKLIKNGSKS